MKNKTKKLNLGCGKDIKEGYVNMDKQKGQGVNITWDADKIPYPFPNETFDEVFSSHAIEHLRPDMIDLMTEIARITKKGGLIHIIVPYYACHASYSPDHKKYFTMHTLLDSPTSLSLDGSIWRKKFQVVSHHFGVHKKLRPILGWTQALINHNPKITLLVDYLKLPFIGEIRIKLTKK